jgi:hypothetical protein
MDGSREERVRVVERSREAKVSCFNNNGNGENVEKRKQDDQHGNTNMTHDVDLGTKLQFAWREHNSDDCFGFKDNDSGTNIYSS